MKGSFFCEACGAEVKGRSDTCPSCGRSFLGVRCPKCGREGSSEEFQGGCPDCGYLAGNTPARTVNTEKRTPGRKADLKDSGTPVPWPEKPRYRRRSEWPAARYWTLSALVVIAVGLILYFWIRK